MVPGSIPGGVTGNFFMAPHDGTMCPGVDSGISPGVKAASAYGWRPTTLVVPNVKKIWSLNLPGTPWATSVCCGMTFTFTFTMNITTLRHGSAAARLLGLWVPIQPGTWMFFSCESCVLSGRGLCAELITRPEESYQVRCVWVWSWILDNEEVLAHWGCCAMGGGGGREGEE